MLLFACVAVRLWRGSGDDLYLLAGLGGLFALASGLTMTSFMRRPEYGAPPPTAEGQPAVLAVRGPVLAMLEERCAQRIRLHSAAFEHHHVSGVG